MRLRTIGGAFCYLVRDAENFYKFTDVGGFNSNGKVDGLQCYTFSTPLPIGYRK